MWSKYKSWKSDEEVCKGLCRGWRGRGEQMGRECTVNLVCRGESDRWELYLLIKLVLNCIEICIFNDLYFLAFVMSRIFLFYPPFTSNTIMIQCAIDTSIKWYSREGWTMRCEKKTGKSEKKKWICLEGKSGRVLHVFRSFARPLFET